MDAFTTVAEDKIRKAINDGDFDNLPGKGKPLKLDDLSYIPENLRMAYRILKNANMINDDIDCLKAELMTIGDLLNSCENNDEKERLIKKKHEKEIRFEELMQKRKSLNSPPSAFYKQKILDRFKK